jgi:outer membrane receptor protein involved in Fe transport
VLDGFTHLSMLFFTRINKVSPWLIVFLMGAVFSARAQAPVDNCVISGRITLETGEPATGATVSLEPTGPGTYTDSDGQFKLALPVGRNLSLRISLIGYRTERLVIDTRRNPSLRRNIRLVSQTQELAETVVLGKSEAQQIRDEPIKAEVISIKELKNQSASLAEAISRAPGVRVRQTGGLGSSANVLVNGYQGRAVKFFRDGVPIDYLGDGYSVSLLPVNLLERVEVYKGVLPVRLGADALGGAINLVSTQPKGNLLDVSLELASFNTQRATISGRITNSANTGFAGVDAFYNHSDNNYRVLAKVVNPDTRTRQEQLVTRFHDGFTNYYTEVYAGLQNTRWADLLRVSLIYFNIDKQEQNGALMTDAFGQVKTYQSSVIPTLRFKKSGQNGRLQFDQFLVYNTLNVRRVDTCHCTYDWLGNRTNIPTRGGEASQNGSLLNIDFTYFTSRSYLSYQLTDRHKLEANVVYGQYHRVGSDPLGPVYNYSKRDILASLAGYAKTVAAVGLESKALHDRFTHSLTAKYYHHQSNGTDAAYTSFDENQLVSSGQRWGLADAIKFDLTPNDLIRLSGELATRLPEQTEVFGDGLFRLSNFSLRPERSTNLNVGYRRAVSGKYSLEANTFYRLTHDLIQEIPVYFPFSQNQNVDQVKGFGLELDGNSTLTKWLSVNGNITYQNLRLFGITNPNAQYLEGARLRNTPYFFFNLGAQIAFNDVFRPNTRLQGYYYYSYVHEFYLENIPRNKEGKGLFERADFDSDLIIPTQNLHTVGLTYGLTNSRWSLGAEVKNIFNANLYDNFRVQRAGRSVHVKLRFLLSNQ